MIAATVVDVEASLGRTLTDEETVQAAVWLDDAEMQIRLRLGDVSLLDQQALAYVEREAVVLKLRNPDGKQQEAIDDYSYRRYDANARGQVYITQDWWNLLSPNSRPRIFSVMPS